MSYFSSSVGKKVVMAVTGSLLLLFVVPHMLGNLKAFAGAEALNRYAEFLQALGPVLWLMRLLMLGALVLHLWFGFRLWHENRAARPIAYAAGRRDQITTMSARWMPYTGLLLLGFILFHLLHLTFHLTHPELANQVTVSGQPDVYAMVVISFRGLGTVLVYAVAMAVLFLHVRHGFASLFQTLGLTTEQLLPRLGLASLLLATLLLIGYLSVPFAALFHLLEL